ncbi:MAG: SDR family oxidoreductase [Chloroflexi bacterium]|nr:SDR family oxidoreductase [Chloroflexota bacterium]
MKGELAGKVALVTGAAQGMGQAIALRFAEEGAKVAVVDINLDGAKKVTREINKRKGKAIAIKCDVSKEKEVKKAVQVTQERLGNINILVNNAGTAEGSFIADLTTEQWRNMFAVHCDGMFFFCRAVIPYMQRGDSIINISSMDGFQGQVFSTHYAAAKGAVIAFTTSLSLELGPKGITVNSIAPGVIRTPMGQMLIEVAPGFEKEIPLVRWGEPADVAELAVFLASPKASYITGQTILVDGGITLANPVNRFTAKLMGLP